LELRILAAVALAALCVSGCASVIEGTTQQIAIATQPESGATCTASNEQGKWSVVTPGSVTVHKSGSVLSVRCHKDGWADGTYYASGKLSSAAMIGAFVPYVGVLNMAADASSGAGTEYPDTVIVRLKPLDTPADANASAAPKDPQTHS
jgi:hypothetical protein